MSRTLLEITPQYSSFVDDQVLTSAKLNEFMEYFDEQDKLTRVCLTGVGVACGFTVNLNKEEPSVSGGTMFPSADYTFSAGSINKILNSFDRFGALNLGGVNPNFFVSLKALETNGIIDIKSTPKLSALNGKEATFTNGSEEFYLIECFVCRCSR